jgi:RND family efflux transporter MFP subunit
LWDQKIGTEVQFLQIKNQKESLAKKVNSIQEQLKMTKIISPINGIVDAVDVKLGQAIAPGFPAIRVINMSSLRVKAEVAESYAARIKKGTDVTIYFPDINDSIQSKVTYASRSINLLSRTFNVEVKLENTKECHPNMYARLKIKDYQSETPVIVIPVKLIQHDKTEEFVMVNASGKSERRTVKTGKSYNGLFEIVNGLKAGDQIITNGYFGLPIGETLNILEK